MNLNFTAPKPIGDGRIMETAEPTRDFWKAWRMDRQALADIGIFVRRDDDGLYHVYRVRHENEQSPPCRVAPYIVRNKTGLKEYQPAAVASLCASLLSKKIALDCSDAGVGKTYHALAVCREFGLTPGIICTKTGITAWRRVCVHFGVRPLFIVNWESVITRTYKRGNVKVLKTSFPYCRAFSNKYTGRLYYTWNIPKGQRYVLIFDECHRANGNGTSMSKVMLAAKDYPIMALSATLADRLSAMRTIGSLCGLFEYHKWQEWLTAQGNYRNRFNAWESVSSAQDMLNINRLLFPAYGCRLRKMDIKGFPPIQNIAAVYDIKEVKEFNSAYQECVGTLQELERERLTIKDRIEHETDVERLKELTEKLKKSAADKLTATLRYRQYAEMLKVPLFVDLCREELEAGNSVVVFFNFTESIKSLASKMRTKNIIWGKQSGSERQEVIDRFQSNDECIIVANIQAGGVSISLHDERGGHPRVALISPTYSAIQLTQALGRIHRSGAKTPAINRLIYAAGTVEEEVCISVSNKLDAIASLNDGDLAEKDIFNLLKK